MKISAIFETMNSFPMVWYPASDGIGWSTITHCTSVNSSSAKTRQNPRSNVDSPRRSMCQRDLDASSLNLNIVALYTARLTENCQIFEKTVQALWLMAYFNNVDSVKQYPLCRGNQRVKQERKRKSGQGLVMTIFGTTDVSYVTLQIRETQAPWCRSRAQKTIPSSYSRYKIYCAPVIKCIAHQTCFIDFQSYYF